MIRFTVLCVGKLKEDYTRRALDDYLTRLSKYAKTEVVEVPESDIEGEGKALLKRLPERCCLVALDLHGIMLDSPGLAEYINKETTRGTSHFVFVIGGSDGIAASVTDRADLRLCLSRLTFTHQMTRVIIAEQLYRAMKINAGEAYHK